MVNIPAAVCTHFVPLYSLTDWLRSQIFPWLDLNGLLRSIRVRELLTESTYRYRYHEHDVLYSRYVLFVSTTHRLTTLYAATTLRYATSTILHGNCSSKTLVSQSHAEPSVHSSSLALMRSIAKGLWWQNQLLLSELDLHNPNISREANEAQASDQQKYARPPISNPCFSSNIA